MITAAEFRRRCAQHDVACAVLDKHLNGVITSWFSGVREHEADRCIVFPVVSTSSGENESIDRGVGRTRIDVGIIETSDTQNILQMKLLSRSPIDFEILPIILHITVQLETVMNCPIG